MYHILKNAENLMKAGCNIRTLYKSHYEVLNLPNTCSPKEIKEAYIKLSKEYHPDRNDDAGSSMKFVEVAKAYEILSKPGTRCSYDFSVSSAQSSEGRRNCEEPDQNGPNPWNDPTLWTNRDKSQDEFHSKKPYYGVKGVKRVSNVVIVFVCFLMASFGVCLEVLAIRNSFTLNRDKLIETSKEAEENLIRSRNNAEKNGNQLQIEMLKKRMKDSKYHQGRDIDS